MLETWHCPMPPEIISVFVDSDDWLASTALEKVCEAFTDEVDSVLFQVVHHYENGEEKVFPMPHFGTLSGAEAF